MKMIIIDTLKNGSYIPLPYLPCPKYIPVDNKLYFATHRVIKESNTGDWSTDEDEFGIACLALEPELKLTHWVLPVRFAVRAAGAPSKRKVKLVMSLSDGSLIMTVQSPFSGEEYGGWGDDNYLFNFEPPTGEDSSGKWGLVKENAEGERVMYVLPTENTPEPNNASWSAGFNQLLVWKDEEGFLHVFADTTPYFLDDWEQDEETKQAHREMEREEKRDLNSLRGFWQTIGSEENLIVSTNDTKRECTQLCNLLELVIRSEKHVKGRISIIQDDESDDENDVGAIMEAEQGSSAVIAIRAEAGEKSMTSGLLILPV